MFSQKFKIANFTISNNSKTLVIAEVGVNHEGNFQKCLKLISNAKKSGADVVKLQIMNPNKNYDTKTSSFKIFKKSQMSDEQIFNIYKYCNKIKMKIFSTFDREKFEFFKKIKPICYKVSSSIFYDYFFIKDLLKTGKPILISSGISDIDDIDYLLNLLEKNKNKKISLLHCRSLYPTLPKDLNLSRIEYIKNKYNIITGFSDHSLGIDAAVSSIHHGAKIIEKHFTLDKSRKGFDHRISLEPKNFKLMVEKIRENEEMVGMYNFSLYNNTINSKKIKKITRRFKTKKNIKSNKFLKEKDLELIRDNSTKNYIKFNSIMNKIINKKTRKNLKSGKFLSLKDFKK
tara:strand:+ start:34 stop:1065 length:1032 start_codon:yes stop_codon:yes gene_type:complete